MNSRQTNLSESYQQQITAACAYLESGQDDERIRGTGYLVGVDLVATCNHVVAGSSPAEAVAVRMMEGMYEGQVIARDAERDCALVRLHQPAVASPPLPLGDGCASGEPFWSVVRCSPTPP